ncbi:hypothetical protein G6O69_11675 [Pseudenhygromyxa sp. WMMC2535]|uniref:hypothetical protein n=1 Tax=Pseudenhygromyxa sp. WMMC2535 TaxID=2712867 RepID=UPI0015570267|nr:hypothetical protein [Pseudenhygromyxa sp. WMMC2535]NVB38490.1 hypothetical protein [Pseudenhygromyxa sp. WMMC2535]
MYLRRNKVRCGDSRRTYLSIAHNVWWSGEGNKKAQSRPIVIASFGVEDKVDVDLARDVVSAVEASAPRLAFRRGEGKAATVRVAQEVRKIEPFLKVLVSRKLGLAQHLPPHPQRAEILEALIRDRLADPDTSMREEEIMTSLRNRLSP